MLATLEMALAFRGHYDCIEEYFQKSYVQLVISEMPDYGLAKGLATFNNSGLLL